jgi:hypothetical protein
MDVRELDLLIDVDRREPCEPLVGAPQSVSAGTLKPGEGVAIDGDAPGVGDVDRQRAARTEVLEDVAEHQRGRMAQVLQLQRAERERREPGRHVADAQLHRSRRGAHRGALVRYVEQDGVLGRGSTSDPGEETGRLLDRKVSDQPLEYPELWGRRDAQHDRRAAWLACGRDGGSGSP